jgi:NADH-quinone oxidoreductase subunit L
VYFCSLQGRGPQPSQIGKSMLVNSVGDLGLALGISAIFLTFKSVDYLVVFALTPNSINETFSFLSFEVDRLTMIAFLLF